MENNRTKDMETKKRDLKQIEYLQYRSQIAQNHKNNSNLKKTKNKPQKSSEIEKNQNEYLHNFRYPVASYVWSNKWKR